MAYFPVEPPIDPQRLREFIREEFRRLAQELQSPQELMRVSRTSTTPDKPRTGDIRYADGVRWMPAQNAPGFYWFDGSAWQPLSLSLGNSGYGWRDEKSDIIVRGTGANDPTWAAFLGNIYAYKLSTTTMNQVWTFVHINHDWQPGSGLHLHVHWSTAGTNTGNVKWNFEYTIAKGHNQQAWAATNTVSVTQAGSGVAYQHMIAESAEITSTKIEPDSLVLVRTYRDPTDGDDTLTDAPYIFFIDAHYKSDRHASRNRAPNFYNDPISTGVGSLVITGHAPTVTVT